MTQPVVQVDRKEKGIKCTFSYLRLVGNTLWPSSLSLGISSPHQTSLQSSYLVRKCICSECCHFQHSSIHITNYGPSCNHQLFAVHACSSAYYKGSKAGVREGLGMRLDRSDEFESVPNMLMPTLSSPYELIVKQKPDRNLIHLDQASS